MSRPRFLADNDLNEHIIEGVFRREPLTEFVRLREVGLAAADDPDVLDHAAPQGEGEVRPVAYEKLKT